MEEFHVWRTPAQQLYTQGKIRRGGLERFGGSGRVIGPSLDLPGDGWGGWQGQGRATHILHLITLPDTLESGVRPHSLQTSEKKGLRGKVSGGWLMVITTKRLVSEESC